MARPANAPEQQYLFFCHADACNDILSEQSGIIPWIDSVQQHST
jgi:hypothetical protein